MPSELSLIAASSTSRMLSSTRHLLQGEPAKQHRDAVARIDACWCLPVSLVQCPQQKHFECGGAAVPQGAVKTAQIPPLPLFEGGVHWSLACVHCRGSAPRPRPPTPGRRRACATKSAAEIGSVTAAKWDRKKFCGKPPTMAPV